MKLTSVQVQNVIDQVQANPIPEEHPVVSQLEKTRGVHTFFLNDNGLHVVEPPSKTDSGKYEARLLKLAGWNDAEKTTLTGHDAEFAGMVELESE